MAKPATVENTADKVTYSPIPQFDLSELFEEFPPSAIPSRDPNSAMVGRLKKVMRGPETEYGSPWIAIFEGVTGEYAAASDDDEDMPSSEKIVPGREYTLWMFHQTLLSQMLEVRPKVGEIFAVRYIGKRVKKAAKNKPENKRRREDYYHAYRVVCPERARITRVEATWDDVAGSESVTAEETGNIPF